MKSSDRLNDRLQYLVDVKLNVSNDWSNVSAETKERLKIKCGIK